MGQNYQLSPLNDYPDNCKRIGLPMIEVCVPLVISLLLFFDDIHMSPFHPFIFHLTSLCLSNVHYSLVCWMPKLFPLKWSYAEPYCYRLLSEQVKRSYWRSNSSWLYRHLFFHLIFLFIKDERSVFGSIYWSSKAR